MRRLKIACTECGGPVNAARAGCHPDTLVYTCINPGCREHTEWRFEFSHITRPSALSESVPLVTVSATGVRYLCACGKRATVGKRDSISTTIFRLYVGCKDPQCGCRFVVTASCMPLAPSAGKRLPEGLLRHLLALYPRHELDTLLARLETPD